MIKKVFFAFVLTLWVLCGVGCGEKEEYNSMDPSQINVREVDGSIPSTKCTNVYYRSTPINNWTMVYGNDGDKPVIIRDYSYDVNGVYIKYEYDEFQRVSSTFKNNKLYEKFFYFSEGMIYTIYNENGDIVESQRYIYMLDDEGKIDGAEIFDNYSEELKFKIDYEYDDAGHIILRRDSLVNGNLTKEICNLYVDDELAGSKVTDYENGNVNGEYVYLCGYDIYSSVFNKLTGVQQKNAEVGCDFLNMILNKGIFAAYNGWTYYTSKDFNLKKIDTNGVVKTVGYLGSGVSALDVRYINVVSDWVYYVYGDSIYRMRQDGSGQQEVVVQGNVSGQLIVKGDMLYYQSKVYNSSTVTHFVLNEFNVNTNENKILYEWEVSKMQYEERADILGIVGETLYYTRNFIDANKSRYDVGVINLTNYEHGDPIFCSDDDKTLIGISDHYLLIKNGYSIEIQDLYNNIDQNSTGNIVYVDVLKTESGFGTEMRSLKYYNDGQMYFVKWYHMHGQNFICWIDQNDIDIYKSGQKEWKDIMKYIIEEDEVYNSEAFRVFEANDFIYYALSNHIYRVKIDGSSWMEL